MRPLGKYGREENDERAGQQMISLKFSQGKREALNILCLGAHSDDIEIGCGGSVLRMLGEYGGLHVWWVVFAANGDRRKEAEQSGHLFLAGASRKEIVVKNFRESFFPYTGEEIKEYFESLRHEFSPDIVFSHYRQDLHQDHRLISELTWNTFRDHLILEYEIPKYDGDLGSPNFFVHLDEPICRRKIKYILTEFSSQKDNHWFSEDSFLAISRLRGIESNAPDKYAEAFYCRKVVLG